LRNYVPDEKILKLQPIRVFEVDLANIISANFGSSFSSRLRDFFNSAAKNQELPKATMLFCKITTKWGIYVEDITHIIGTISFALSENQKFFCCCSIQNEKILYRTSLTNIKLSSDWTCRLISNRIFFSVSQSEPKFADDHYVLGRSRTIYMEDLT